MVFQCINIRQVAWEVLKTAAFGLGFQHFPLDLANVNARKIMFDPYIETYLICFQFNFSSSKSSRRKYCRMTFEPALMPSVLAVEHCQGNLTKRKAAILTFSQMCPHCKFRSENSRRPWRGSKVDLSLSRKFSKFTT